MSERHNLTTNHPCFKGWLINSEFKWVFKNKGKNHIKSQFIEVPEVHKPKCAQTMLCPTEKAFPLRQRSIFNRSSSVKYNVLGSRKPPTQVHHTAYPPSQQSSLPERTGISCCLGITALHNAICNNFTAGQATATLLLS